MIIRHSCEQLLQDGTHCGRRAVARVIPSIEDLTALGWLACERHAELAARSMRRHATPDLDLRITEITTSGSFAR